MDWPTAFCLLGVAVTIFALVDYNNHLRAEVMKEAIRHGATEFSFQEDHR